MEFSRLDPSQVQMRQQLFGRAFPETKGTAIESLEHYRWKFHSKSDTEQTSYEYVLKEKVDMVGYYAAIPYVYSFFRKKMIAGMVCDVMTDPVHQGKGIFTKLGRYATDDLEKIGLDITTGYPVRPEVIPGHLKVGWKVLFQLPLWVRLCGTKTLPILKALPMIFHHLSRSLIEAMFYIFELFSSERNFSIQEYQSISDLPKSDYDFFLQRWMSQQSIALNKEYDFLKWRLNAPQSQYRLLAVKSNSEIVTLLILRAVVLKRVRTLAILDWMQDANVKIPAKLISKKLRVISRELDTDLIALMVNPHLSKRLNLFLKGFFRIPISFTFILKNLSKLFQDNKLFDEKNWHLMWIDSDDL